MKKSNFIALVLGTVSTVCFALGMCMALLPEWNAFQPGIITGCAGLLLALSTVLVWRKMEGKALLHLSMRNIGTILFGILGTLVLGVGMCFVMVWSEIVLGILIGLVGMILLLCLIPLSKRLV